MLTKENKFQGDYCLGLDIGVESVGWAVVDEQMNLVKRKGRHLWGSRLFERAINSKSRREKRSLRRRLLRRRVRLLELRNIFSEFVNDESFFQRLNESFLQKVDRSQNNSDILFYKDNITILNFSNNSKINISSDKDYFKHFPTIFHLKQKLIEDKESQFDPKLIYLAVHNILKYRGNFLYENLDANDKTVLLDFFDSIALEYNYLNNADENENNFIKNLDKTFIINTLIDNTKTSKEQHTILTKGIKNNLDKKQITAFVNMLLGYKFNYLDFFESADSNLQNKNKESAKISFNDQNIDESIVNTGEYSEFLTLCRNLYSTILYQKIMNGERYVSNIMVKRFEEYKKQLVILKEIFKKCLSKQEYNDFFKNLKSNNNYARYTEGEINCSLENLYKEIKAKLAKIDLNKLDNALIEKINYINFCLNNGTLLIKPRNRNNGVFPRQANRIELETILNNQSAFYPKLKDMKEKILQLFDFKIDYYVGPLAINNINKNNFGWLVRKKDYENATITAFNYKNAINFEQTQLNFIEKMTGTCSYILGEKALPKNSIYYCWFNVINEVSNLSVSINGGPYQSIRKFEIAGKPVVEYIFSRLCETNVYKKVDLINLLSKEYPKVDVRGFSNDVSLISNLKPYRDFMRIFGKVDNSNIDLIENIIRDVTIFGENKKGLKQKLTNSYTKLNEEEIKNICNLGYKGWGNLSKKLIYGLKSVNDGKTILQIMGENIKNFSSVFNDTKYQFKEQVEKLWAESNFTTKEQIKELACSSEIKRGISQAFLIIKELEKVMGKPPLNIFIEFAREEGKKGLTQSRQNRLLNIYNSILKDYKETYNDINSRIDLGKLSDKNYSKEFDKEKFYLYYIQGGKCMYTGSQLDINKLEQYDVDHIIPQSIIKDDSLDNKVLVLKEANAQKLDSYVVPEEFRNKMQSYWRQLKDVGLISIEKYTRLTKKELLDSDINRFINRQLVETRQITKNTAMILSEYFKRKGVCVGIYPVKAEINSLFRKRFGYPKGEGARALNDLHHAKDAYITVFMGSFLKNNFNLDIIENRHTTFNYSYLVGKDNESENNKYKKYGLIFYYMNKENSNFTHSNTNSISTKQALQNFDKNYYKVDCFVSKKTEITNKGQLFKETLYKNKINAEKFGEEQKTLISIGKKFNKNYLNVDNYGGYTTMQFSKFAVVSYENKKGKSGFKLVGIPRLYTIPTTDFNLTEYFNANNLFNAKILCYIPKFQLIKDPLLRNIYITGLDAKQPASQFVINKENKILNTFIYFVYKYDIDIEKWGSDRDYSILEGDINNKENIENSIHKIFKQFSEYYLNHLEKYYPQDSSFGKLKLLLMQANDDTGRFSVQDKIKLTKELLKITANNSQTGNLANYKVFDEKGNKIIRTFDCYDENGEKVKLAENLGKISSQLQFDKAYLIYNSITGIYTKKKKILN